MASYPVRAVVLSRTKLGESDLILTMLSDRGELVRAVAKGARKPKSKMGAASGLFRCNDWLLHTGRNLDIVSEARTFVSHSHLTVQYRAALGASVIAEFVAKTNLPGQSDPRIFDMTMVALGELDRCAQGDLGSREIAFDTPLLNGHSIDSAVDGLVLAYLIKSLAMHGYRPSGETCAECGLPVDRYETVEWSGLAAGVLCHDCAPSSADARAIPCAAASWIEYLLGATLRDASSTDIPRMALDDLFTLVVGLLDTHVQTRLRALEVYRTERASAGIDMALAPPTSPAHAVD